jgi:hypothetical protein
MATDQPSPPDHLRVPNDNHAAWLFRRIWDRLNQRNEHFMGCVVGREGSGKSYTALRIANEIDPSFSADRVLFDVSKLLEILNDGEHEPGNFYVLDEAGVQMGNRTWHDRAQILANQALQLVRNHNLGLVFTLPRLGELDSQAQGRLQAVLELVDKEEGEYVSGKWKWLDPDRMDETGTIYKKYPRRRQNGRVFRITRLNLRPPAPEIVEPYEDRKRAFQEEFYRKTIEQFKDDEEEEEADPREIAAEIADAGVEEYVSEHAGNGRRYINRDLIQTDHGLSNREAKAVKSLLEHQVDL